MDSRGWLVLSFALPLGAIPLSTRPAITAEPPAVEEDFVAMFNGRDLSGWEGKPGWWFVEDATITAESTPEKPCEKHNYLFWRGGKPGDFELRLEYRLVGGNSGIQFRSRELPDWDTNGYQADMDAAGEWTGAAVRTHAGRHCPARTTGRD